MRATRAPGAGSGAIEVRLWRTLVLGAVLTAASFTTAGCGDQKGASSSESSPPVEATVPADLERVLARDGVKVSNASQAESQHSADEVMAAFSELYDPSTFKNSPTLYTVEIETSDETRLPAGRVVEMVHIPGVEREVSPPAPPQSESGATPKSVLGEVIATDMFTFFDATTLDPLASIYIGP
jgi:hypothetical protein